MSATSRFQWHALMACIFLTKFGITIANPQVYHNGPNGKLQLLNGQTICGDCPSGTQREQVSGPYCGRCLPPSQTCAVGHYLVNGQCQPCPCPGTNGDRRFGTSCRVDRDGQVTCDCPSEYTGRDCSQCAPGTIQNNQYPYNCVRINSTNSFSVTCPSGNRCNLPQISQILQQRQSCPYTSQPVGNGCPYSNQTSPINGCGQLPCRSGECQGSTPCQTECRNGGSQNGSPCKNGGTQCSNGGCQAGTPCQNGDDRCSSCQTSPCRQACNGNGNGGCPAKCQNGGSTQCPCPNPCPCPLNACQNPCQGSPTLPCPILPITPTDPPIVPPWTTPPPPICPGPVICPPPPVNSGCPFNPNQPCPNPGAPCPNNPNQPCPNPGAPCPINPNQPCPSPCPNPCSTCPQIPPCPNCELTCPPCPTPDPCPVCRDGNCQICPDPCQKCPDPCRECPKAPACPDCVVTCPNCTCDGRVIIDPPLPISEACICDPRGTSAQIGNQCICKVNVQGSRCDQCKTGYFGLSSSRPEGCLACFCSGLSASCSLTPYYTTRIRTDRSPNCTVELTDENHSIVYSQGTSGFSWDGIQATLSKGVNTRLFWSLPACLKGDRVTSYGGILSFARMCSGSGNSLGADHEVMLVGGSGATVFWTTFDQQNCDGKWVPVDVLLAEPAYWSSWKGEQYRRATRGDIMEVLADLQLILIRATFTTNTLTTSIRNVSMTTVSHSSTLEGVAMQVESCRCPTGYRGLSCENCAPGYYRDTTDVSKSVFGACKPCPCGKTAEGCHLSSGHVVCKCKQGFSGPLCQDKEVITVTCDPFRIREVEGAVVDFTCSFETNSKRRLLMRLGREGNPDKAEETSSITRSIALEKDLRRVACEVVDQSGVTWAVVYCAIEIISAPIVQRPPPPRLIAIIPSETFLCVEEGQSITMTCELHNFGQRRVNIEWRKEGNPRVMGGGKDMTIRNAAPEDAGTYICSASDGEVTGAGQISLMVRRLGLTLRNQYPVNATGDLEKSIHARHGGDYPNYPYQMDSYQKDQADAPAVTEPQLNPTRISNVPKSHPKAMVEPAEIMANPGDTVILRCNATGDEPLKFYWKSGSSDYIPVHVRISRGALIFRSLRSQDAGVYYCVAWNHLGQSTARATILLNNSINAQNAQSGKPAVEILHPEIIANYGENVNFQCKSNQTGVKFVWSRVGEKMPDSSQIRTDGLLTLYRVSKKDEGTYFCTVSNAETGEKTVAQAVLKLHAEGKVLAPPKVTITPKSPHRVRTGENVRLLCESTGNPLPNVTWVRSLDGIEKRLVTSVTNQAVYEIKQMSFSEVGKYMCIAVSNIGRKSESMSLVIDDGKPCLENEFRCKSGDQCIPREDRCDTEKDCKDGSDEDNCKGSRRIRRNVRRF